MIIKNLDTGESTSIEHAHEIFKDVALAQTMADLLAERQKHQSGSSQSSSAAASDSEFVNDLMDQELNSDLHHQNNEEKHQNSKSKSGFFNSMKNIFGGHNTNTQRRRQMNHIKVKTHNKYRQELSELRCIQQVTQHNGPIWTMKWSDDGSFLATGGQDSIVRVWLVKNSPACTEIATPEQLLELELKAKKHSKTPSTDIIYTTPFRLYSGHKADVIDLAWSKDNFLLSASIDKTVRLWHVTRKRSLCIFQHSDFVTSVSFHPIEDRYFISGSFDKKLRIWNIPEHRVVEWAQTANIVTAAALSNDGTMAVAGLYNGQCIFYQTKGLKYFTQIDCRNRHGKYRKGKKVTALEFNGDGTQLLITTNDSRLRLYDMNDYSMIAKFKGLDNDELQIKASFSADYKYVICGSEDEQTYIWDIYTDYQSLIKKEYRNDSYEYFKSNQTTSTGALFVKPQTIQYIYGNDDHAATEEIKHLLVTCGYEGDIKFFENRGPIKEL